MTALSQPQNSSESALSPVLVDAEIVVNASDWISNSEKLALSRFKENFNRGGMETRPLSTSKALQLYSLFLDGNTLAAISEINPELGLGTIVNSAIEGKWNIKRQEYLDELYSRANDRAMQVVAEGANFMALLLSAAHKKHGSKLKKFLQTEDPKELLDCMSIDGLRGYREGVEILMKLTGQDSIKKVQVSGDITHTEKPAEPEPTAISLATSVTELAALKRKDK
jgi:hypothetical protein